MYGFPNKHLDFRMFTIFLNCFYKQIDEHQITHSQVRLHVKHLLYCHPYWHCVLYCLLESYGQSELTHSILSDIVSDVSNWLASLNSPGLDPNRACKCYPFADFIIDVSNGLMYVQTKLRMKAIMLKKLLLSWQSVS